MNNLAISIVVPIWNCEKYFKECLYSILSQSLYNIEVIIVDDASTDKSRIIAEEFALHDSRITVVHNTLSIGSGPSRNIAISLAQGEYIAFIDSDDVYPSNDILEVLYYNAKKNNADICGGSLYTINDKGSIINKKIPNQFFTKNGWCYYKNYQFDGGFYRFIYRRIFLKKNNIYFSEFRRFQDALFFVKAMTTAKKFYALKKYSYAYRKEHKCIIWTYKNTQDHLNCLYIILEISRTKHLNKLHYLMTKNLLECINYKMSFFTKILLIKNFFKIIKFIDWNIIKIENEKNNVKITLVKILYRYFFNML